MFQCVGSGVMLASAVNRHLSVMLFVHSMLRGLFRLATAAASSFEQEMNVLVEVRCNLEALLRVYGSS